MSRIFSFAFFLCVFCTTLSAVIFTVDTNSDAVVNTNATTGSLRYCLLNAVSLDEINFNPSLGVILIGSDTNTALPVLTGLTLNGNGNTISGQSLYPIFFALSGSNTLSDLILTDGKGEGGNGGNGHGGGGGALGAGGGLFINSGATADLTNVQFVNCQVAGGNGGAGSTSGIIGGGGGGGGYNSNGGNSNIPSTFNSGGGGGGGVFNSPGGDALVGSGGGGGVYSSPGGSVVVDSLASGGGGGVFNSPGGNAGPASSGGGGGFNGAPGGSDPSMSANYGGSGGGGLMTAGSPPIGDTGGAGGTGTGGDGGDGESVSGNGSQGADGGPTFGGGGAGGSAASGTGGNGGDSGLLGGGGAGGFAYPAPFDGGDGGNSFAQGGGGGGGLSSTFDGGNGGNAAFGGGGGGGQNILGGGGVGGNGGSSMLFGGGGGAGLRGSSGGAGGLGGGGGGAGSGMSVGGTGGFGAGDGGNTTTDGDGGSAFGGAVFIADNSSLIMTDGVILGNSAGPAGTGATSGEVAGDGFYLMGPNSSLGFEVSPNNLLILPNSFAGEGIVTKTGAGTLRVTSNNQPFSGMTNINDGVLVLALGATLVSDVEVNAPGTLTGRGTIGTGLVTDTLNNQGTVSPGNPVGILTVNGSYTQSAAGTLFINALNATPTNWGQLNVNGPATINGNLVLNFLLSEVFLDGDEIVVLKSNNLTGTFTFSTVNEPTNVDVTVVYENEQVIIRFSVDVLPPSGLKGKQLKNKFPTQTEYVNRLTWEASADPDLIAYAIYRNGVRIGQVSAKCPLVFDDHNQPRCVPQTYEVRTVDFEGNEGPPATIVVP